MPESSEPVHSDVPQGLTIEARRARARFDRAYQKQLQKIRKVALSILVWGPTPDSSSPVSAKRQDIRKALRDRGHYSAFSEELSNSYPDVPLKMREYAQAAAADLIIVLVEDAPGASAEAHDFCNHEDLAPKMLVMFPKRWQAGYSAQGAMALIDVGYGGVYWYEDGEIQSCTVLQKAVDRAEARRCVRIFSGGR